MANYRAFNGDQQLALYRPMPVADFIARFPGVRGINAGWSGERWVGWVAGKTMNADTLPVERLIAYKAWPSKHECNAKCLNGKHNGTCECQCGGKNHGAGAFRQLVAA